MLSKLLIMSDASAASDHVLDCVKRLRTLTLTRNSPCSPKETHARPGDPHKGVRSRIENKRSISFDMENRNCGRANARANLFSDHSNDISSAYARILRRARKFTTKKTKSTKGIPYFFVLFVV